MSVLLPKKGGIKCETANLKEKWWTGKFHLFESTVFMLRSRK